METKESPRAGGEMNGAAPAATAWYARPLVWALVLALLAAGVFGMMLWEKWEAEKLALARNGSAYAQQRERNDAFARYLDELRALLTHDPCDIGRALSSITPPPGVELPVLPGATSPDGPATPRPLPGAAPSGPAPSSTPAETTPVVPETTQAPGDAGASSFPATRPEKPAALLEQATVLILAPLPNGFSMGTGFFISNDTILTNAHVVRDARECVFINKALGSVRKASILMRTNQKGLDFAVLRTAPFPVHPLAFAHDIVTRTEKVCAWGFPGAISKADPKFLALLQGKGSQAPEVIYSEGSVNAVLDRQPTTVVHSATLSQGNSGGPLVNERGEVVGINTQIRLDDQSYRQSSFSIASPVITAFLKANSVPFTTAPAAQGK